MDIGRSESEVFKVIKKRHLHVIPGFLSCSAYEISLISADIISFNHPNFILVYNGQFSPFNQFLMDEIKCEIFTDFYKNIWYCY